MTVALYCRVSTDEQAEHGFSIEYQKARLAAFADSQGWSDTALYVDDGYSGTKLDRPALRRLIRHCREGRIEHIVVYRLDRLSRRQRDVLYLLEDVFELNGATFRSATEPFDTSTPLGKAMLGILAVFAQLERETIIERAKGGIAQRATQGLWHGGPSPFGYRATETGVLEVVENEAAVVREMFRRFVAGHSQVAIARYARARIAGRSWLDHSFVQDVLNRAVYAGYIQHNERIIPGQHAPIVDQETWRMSQQEWARRRNQRRPYGRYLLSGLVICSECGATYKHNTWRRSGSSYQREFYVCSTKAVRAPDCPHSRSVKQQTLEEQVVDAVMGLSVADLEAPQRVEDDGTVDRLEMALRDVDTRTARLVAAIETGAVPVEMVQPRVEQLATERAALLRQLDDALEGVEEVDPEKFNATMDALRTAWPHCTDEERAQLLRLVVRKIVIYPDRHIEITWNN